MKTAKVKVQQKEQNRLYDLFHIMSADELKSWYDAYITGYPTHVAPMVRCIAVLRGLDVSDWKEFYR